MINADSPVMLSISIIISFNPGSCLCYNGQNGQTGFWGEP